MIQLVRNCDNNVEMVVCQPQLTYSMNGRKSTLLSPAKKHKLKTRPIRVRFAESVCVNGSPLFPVICCDAYLGKCNFLITLIHDISVTQPSAFSLSDVLIPPMANVLKVFLENGQTKSFKYDSTTTVQVISRLVSVDKVSLLIQFTFHYIFRMS